MIDKDSQIEIPAVSWERYHQTLEIADTVRPTGRVVGMIGLTVEADGPHARVGEMCMLEDLHGQDR